jgi:hypothetical protein
MGWKKTDTKDALEKRLDDTNLNKKEEPAPAKPSVKPAKYKTQSIRLPENYMEILREHFEEQGTSISGGIRQLVYKYMKDNGLI